MRNIVIIILAIFLIGSCSNEEPGLTYPSEIVINASKGGGTWWYPQGIDCDTTLYHQGKGLTDVLKEAGFSVYESCRQENIDLDEFPNIKLLIIAGSFFPYNYAESKNIADYVRNGGKLMLLVDHTPNNGLPYHLGLDFRKTNTNDVIIEFRAHEITGNSAYEIVSNGVSGLNKSDYNIDVIARMTDATFLDTNYNDVRDENETIAPIFMGTMEFGKGSILFSGDVNIWQFDTELFMNAISWFNLE